MAPSNQSKNKVLENDLSNEANPAPRVHVAEAAAVSTDRSTVPGATGALRYRVSLAYLPELFIYLVLLGGLLTSVSGLAAESWRALEGGKSYQAPSHEIVALLATFLVSLVGSVWFGLRTANAEHLQPWRLQQKWRRGLYGVFLAIASLGLIGALIQAFTAKLSWVLKVESATPYDLMASPFMGTPFHQPAQWQTEVGIGLTTALLIGLVLYGVSREYVLSWRRYTKFALAVLGLSGLILGGVLAASIYDKDNTNKKCQPAAPSLRTDEGGASPIWANGCANEVVPDYY